MTKQQKIAAFVDTRIAWPRVTGRFGVWDTSFPWRPSGYAYSPAARPSIEELATELLQDAEFRALELGTWLGTTDGELITEAVEMVTSPFYAEDIKLLVSALQRTAQLQQVEGERAAGRFALWSIGIAAGVAVLYALASSKRDTG